MLEIIQDKFSGICAEVSLAPLSDTTWLTTFFNEHLLREKLEERKTYVFGIETPSLSIVGPGIISIPLQSSNTGWAIVASGHVRLICL